MANRRTSIQAVNGIRLDTLSGLKGLLVRIHQAEREDSKTGNSEYHRLVDDTLDSITFVRLVNLVDAMNQNQLRLRDQFRRFVKAYMANDKPTIKKILLDLASVKDDTKTLLGYRNTMRFTRDMFKETKPTTTKE